MDTVRLASGSDALGLMLAAEVERELEARPDPVSVAGVVIDTSSDEAADFESLVAEVLDGEADAAVVSAARMPLCLPPGIDIGAAIRKSDSRYQCVARTGVTFAALPTGSRIVALDPVARAQILHSYPGLRLQVEADAPALTEEIRRGVWAAAILPPEVVDAGSMWGLQSEPVAVNDLVPAVGQGVIALLVRAGGGPRDRRIAALNDSEVMACLRAERAFLRQAAAVSGCAATARATLRPERIEVAGMIVDMDGAWMVSDQAEAMPRYGEIIALEVAESCVDLALARRAEARETRADERLSARQLKKASAF